MLKGISKIVSPELVKVLCEMGHGGGPDGGNVVYVGTPAKLARTDTPTGRALAAHGRP